MTVNYQPLAFAFNPVVVEAESETKCILLILDEHNQATIQIALTRERYKDNPVRFDLMSVAQSMFDPKRFKPKENDDLLLKTLSFRITGDLNQHVPSQTGGLIKVIWGALQIGETYSQKKKLTWFRHFPFTVPLYLDKEETVKYARDDNPTYQYYVSLQPGKYNLPVHFTDARENVFIDVGPRGGSGIFDYTFDYTFRGADRVKDPLIEIEINECTEGIYLRWINRLGEWRYYLFDGGPYANEIKNRDIDLEEEIVSVGYPDEYNPGTNRPIGKESRKTVRLSVPSIDKDTYSFLESLAESPRADWFRGYDNGRERWVGVNIAPLTLSPEDSHLLDFECTMIYPDTFIQHL